MKSVHVPWRGAGTSATIARRSLFCDQLSSRLGVADLCGLDTLPAQRNRVQRLIADAPNLLPLAGAPQVSLVGREVRIGPGSLDILLIEHTGSLAVVEVKLDRYPVGQLAPQGHVARSLAVNAGPEADLDLNAATVEVVRLRHLVEFQGEMKTPVKHITLQGLILRHAARTFMDTKEPLLRSDWTGGLSAGLAWLVFLQVERRLPPPQTASMDTTGS